MSITFINTSEKLFLSRRYIYRYTTIDNALEMLSKSLIKFRNPEFWNDPFEKLFLNASFHIEGKEYPSPLKNNIYCICFTGTDSSEAFWNIYSPNKDGIRLKVNRKKLLETFDDTFDIDFYVGKVQYKKSKFIKIDNWENDTKSIVEGKITENFIRSMFQKRRAFKYEDEYRIIIVPRKKTIVNELTLIANYKPIFSDLLIHPLVGENFANMLIQYFSRTFKVRIRKSVLYKEKAITYSTD